MAAAQNQILVSVGGETGEICAYCQTAAVSRGVHAWVNDWTFLNCACNGSLVGESVAPYQTFFGPLECNDFIG